MVAPALPGAGSDALLDVANTGRDDSAGRSYRPSLAPFIDIGKKLDDVEDQELFTVRSDLPDYWRIAALDRYSGDNGGQWTLSAEGEGSVQVGLPSDDPGGTLVQQFSIGPLGERWLPAAFRPVAIDLDDTLVVKSSDTLVADASDVTDLDYVVASKLPPLAGTQFTAAQIAATAGAVPSAVAPYTTLPESAEITEIARWARQVVGDRGATTPYAQAKALRDYFRDTDFVYDTDVGSLDNGSAILEFLRAKHGFCVQFASAYAVMARTLGIPARVAVGFTPGTADADGRYHVTSHDAHAWPEIYLTGIGWTHLFDPTPAQSETGAAGGSNLPDDTAPGTTATTSPTATTTPTVTAPPTGGGAGTPEAPGSAPATPTLAPATPTSASDGGLGPWLLVIAVLAGVALVIGAYVTAVLVAKRRRRDRRRNADDPARVVAGAWEEALDRLREADLTTDPALTPIETARRGPARARTADGRAAPRARARVQHRPLRRWCDRVRRRTRRVDVARRARGRARRRSVVDAALAPPPRSLHLHASLTRVEPRESGAAARVTVSGAQLGDERAAVGVEVAHLVLHLIGEAVDGDEQRELPVAEGVEDLSVVATRPHGVAVGHQPQAGEVVARPHQLRDRPTDAGHRQPGVEQRGDHAQRDEVTERVRARGVGVVGDEEPDALPGVELGGAAPREPGGLDRGVAHRGCRRSVGRVVATEALAPPAAGTAEHVLDRAVAHRAGEALHPGLAELAHVVLDRRARSRASRGTRPLRGSTWW